MGVIDRQRRRAVAALLGVAALSLNHNAGAAEPTPTWVGTGSCAATACHNGRREPLGLKGSEYTFSGAYDPHGRAFSVLYDERSRVIQRNLKHLASVEDARPFENDLCLRCHVHQGYDSSAPRARSATFALEDGVGCEGCHGPAGKWLVPHTEYWWKGLTDDQKQRDFGLTPTKDLLVRGRTCVECHVGAGTTEVNHDLVAAGHPRLNFEYGSQLAKLPKHWRVDDDKARHPDYESKVWALGQVIAAKASLDLLESRARRSLTDASTPWPEFAEYSCFSCHHELAPKGWRQDGRSASNRPGSLPWGTWYFPVAKATGLSGLDPDAPGSPLDGIGQLMSRPYPDATKVVERARAASSELGRLADGLNRGRIATSDARAMLDRALKLGDDGRPVDWDKAAQQYLAIVALDKALADSNPRYADPAIRASLDRMLEGLNLPMQVKVGVTPEAVSTFDSPRRYDPKKVGDDLRTLQAALPQH